LKNKDGKKALVHLNVLNPQLTTLGNSSSIQYVKVLIDDATKALNGNDNNSAIVHLNLVKQQLTATSVDVTPSSISQSDKKQSNSGIYGC
jgi:hypothetical protein